MPADPFGFALPEDRDRLLDLGKLAGGLVHELKNPLGVILLNAELLLNQSAQIASSTAERERLEKRLKRIVDSGRNLRGIVDSFLSFARPERPDPDAVDVNALLGDLLDEQGDACECAQVTVSFHPDDHLALMPADRHHLRSIFLNVIKNAIEALSDRPLDRRLLVVTRSGKEQVRVVIANNGPPLPEKVAANLFEPFRSSKEGGTGLGLAIVHRLVEMHHGTVTVSSDPDQGVSFTFEFPTPLGPARPRAELPIPEAEAVVRDEDDSRPSSDVRRPT
ncbi:MAG: HAMP domain-containing histidine kinase, partial [Planctomycetes bacterium]|nr:HAMP domain-containing histidine kinase [Planctomycetota bacterium]